MKAPALQSSERSHWLALNRAPGLGAVLAHKLLGDFGSPGAILEADAATLAAAGVATNTRAYLNTPDWSAVDADLQWLSQPDSHLVVLKDPHYPERLREIPNPPLVLFIRGDPDLLSIPQLALVGSRNPTPAGAETAFAFARTLASLGLAITSGLARGIDGAGHRGALAGGGFTIAVAGNGLDRVYPAAHRELAREIAADGALVSEFPPGTPPLAKHFPRRNRIISGLSVGVLVVEAAARSGSLITARLAGEQGREVFAIPGSIHNPVARGCHALIRDGAKLVESANDILEELGPQLVNLTGVSAVSREQEVQAHPELDREYSSLLDHVGYEPTPVDILIERTGLTAEVVSSMLLVLELRGYVSSASGGLYSRVPKRE